jgi:hypothetical protein
MCKVKMLPVVGDSERSGGADPDPLEMLDPDPDPRHGFPTKCVR